MTDRRRRFLRNVILWVCVATGLIVLTAFVDVVGIGSTPWYGQAGVSINGSGRPFQAVVASLDPGEAAERAGLRIGDAIDIRANSAIERWQWFDGFPTPIVGKQATLSVQRGARHLRIPVTAPAWNLKRYWYFFVGPAGMFFVVMVAALITLRAEPTDSNLTLVAALAFLATGALASTNDFALPWVEAYVALAILANCLPLAAAFWVLHAATFGTPVNRLRRTLAIASYGTLGVIVACNTAQAFAIETLWLNPYSWWMGPLIIPWAIFITIAVVCSALAIRSASGVERKRAMWSLATIATFFTTYMALTYLPIYTGSYGLYAIEVGLFNVNFFTLPVLLAYVTVSRRLIDIGFVLNRAAVFTAVSAIVIGAFMIVEWAIGTWLTSVTHIASSSISLGIAIALGLSLRYIHHHADRFVDRAFRKRHDDEAALHRFAHECSFVTDSSLLVRRTIDTVARHTACDDVSIVLSRVDVDENDPAMIALQAWRTPLDLHLVAGTELRGECAFPMIVRGTLTGVLVCGAKSNGEAFAPDELKALAAVAQGVGTTLDVLTSKNADALDVLRIAITDAIVEMRDSIVTELRARPTQE